MRLVMMSHSQLSFKYVSYEYQAKVRINNPGRYSCIHQLIIILLFLLFLWRLITNYNPFQIIISTSDHLTLGTLVS